MYFTDRHEHCKENVMQHYGPFDKPYGFFTRSGLIERAKAFLVLFQSILVMMFSALITLPAQSVENTFLKILIVASSAPFFFIGLLLMALGVVWAYFPEFKPDWRKRLTW